jgi:hypothetical protein
MGVYCSLMCVLEALPRLELLEADFRRRGIGMKPIKNGEAPPKLPPPVERGGPR